jgi:hypothetical protein
MMDDPTNVRTRLDADRKDLLDLSLRNPLLNYRPRVRALEFVGESPADLFRILVREGRAMAFLPAAVEDPATTPSSELPEANPTDTKLQTSLPADQLQARLLAISYAARTAVEEQGVNTLFLALGLLTWYEDDRSEKLLRAPLVLVPVELERSSARERFRLRRDVPDLDVNLSLAEKLRAEFGLNLPDLPEMDELDVDRYFDAVAEAVRDQARWNVDRTAAVLAFFSFGKFLMYRDLEAASWPEGEGPEHHIVVRALLGEGFGDAERTTAHPPYSRGGDRECLILDADETQCEALREVAAGRTMVIQGPPGTGKSQTITNLVADAIGRGRTVLVVAEKLAALDVVKRRLDAAGLGEACLELHSHKIGKKAVLEQIRRALSSSPPRSGPPGDDFVRCDELAARLDAYAGAINAAIGASGVSPHEAIGELLKVKAGGNEHAMAHLDLPDLADASVGDYRRRLEWVELLQARLNALGRLHESPFYGSRRACWLPGDEDRLQADLRVARHATAALAEAAAALAQRLQWPAAVSRSACATLLHAARLAAALADWPGVPLGEEWDSRRQDVHELLQAGLALGHLRREYDPALLPEAWEQDLRQVRLVLNTLGRRGWRHFSVEYRRAVERLTALCRAALPWRLADRLALVDAVLETKRHRATVHRHEALAMRLFGRRWRGEVSDWLALATIAERVDELHRDLRDGRFPPGMLGIVAKKPTLAELEYLTRGVEAALAAHGAAVATLRDALELDESVRFGDSGGLAERPFEEQHAILEDWVQNLRRFEDLAGFNRLAARGREEGLAGFVTLAETWPRAGDRLADAFRKHWYEGLVRRAYRERPELADFEVVVHERAQATFRELDRRALLHTRTRIAQTHFEKLPRHEGGGQLALLRRELAKRARHLPVRQLMARAGIAVQAIKPVFLMSPLSVASYLPPDGLRFDLVVFDEASQVRPLDALGALLRGRQAVVVGDSRQLPPTSFFDRLTAGVDAVDDEDDGATSEVESILGLFVAQGAPERMLRWHYRSRHESLIAVSNREFYDGRLVVFPSPDTARREAGLVLHHLPEAIYDRGRTRTNPVEADTVASAVMAFARAQMERPARHRLSLGVATFSMSQREAVRDRLERLRREEPALEAFFDPGGADPFFVKNLENVQGDERDVIFISVGYGRTADGAVALNFGPLNSEGGERRLNVLITRARLRCEVFTNLAADQLAVGRSRSRGVQAFRAFLAYAEQGREDDESEADRPPASRLAAAVHDALEVAGCAVHAQLGSDGCRLDLTIAHPSQPGRDVLAIETDGPSYREAGPARDRDRLRPHVLERLGWRLVRAWAPAWLRDPGGECERVLQALRDTSADGVGVAESSTSPPPCKVGPNGAEVTATATQESTLCPATEVLSAEVPRYQPAGIGPKLDGQDLVSMPSDSLADLVAEVVRFEGPVHISEVVRRLADAASLKRLVPRVQASVETATERCIAAGSVRRQGEFLWPADVSVPLVRDRSSLTSRRLDLVAPEEIALAIEQVVRSAYGMQPAAIPSAVCRLLGFPRMSDEMRDQVNSLVETMVRDRRLITRGEHLIVQTPSA